MKVTREKGQGARKTKHVLSLVACTLYLGVAGCGYTTRPGLATYLKTIHVKPLVNKIDLTQLATANNRFPLYRHGMETEVTKEILNRFQFTGLLRPAGAEKADCRLEGELVEFRRDALRYDANQKVEEWRLNVVVNLKFYDLHANADEPAWEESGLTGDATYFELGAKAESESAALDRAITDLARRVVERIVENW